MATEPKRWPNHAEWARLDALAAAADCLRMLDALLDDTNDAHLVRQFARIMEKVRTIEKLLQAVGPKG